MTNHITIKFKKRKKEKEKPDLLLDSSEISRSHTAHLILSEPDHLRIHHPVKHLPSPSSRSFDGIRPEQDRD